ncbi:MAG: N-acyl-D-amino-acid deacylase family protein [Cyclobacteriaceae bacterium]|nr:D-aminoacylase [Flammeovirgaceae bacterium]
MLAANNFYFSVSRWRFSALSIHLLFVLFLSVLTSCAQPKKEYAVIIRNGMIYDGSGSKPYKGDVAIQGDTLAAMGDLSNAVGKEEIDAKGLAISPGFINMLSWADGSLLKDGRSMSDIKQGVTLEIFGEGWSPGPRKKKNSKDTLWTSLGEYFEVLRRKGVSPNFGSFVGATTVRNYVLGFDNRKPTPQEFIQMKELVRAAMKEGAMGLGSSLIYAPADYASTEELIELSKVVSEYNGMYITHMRSESDKIFPAMNEFFRIAREANVSAEIYHLKINNEWNWNKIDTVLAKIDSAQKAGLKITADMYTYNASGTSITARLPTWVQEGGAQAMRKRFKNPALRKRLLREMELGIPSRNSDPKDVMVMGFRTDSLNQLYRGKRLSEIAAKHGKNANETILDLLVADKSSIPCIFFLISEDNIRKMLPLPYVSVCSDAASIPDEPPFNNDGTHPRAYGSFARLLAKYSRDEKLFPTEEAIRKMTSLPAANLKIAKRGLLKVGYYADVVLFDPATIQDHATFEDPHQYSTGVVHVFVNGVQVLKEGEHTNKKPGRLVVGPGYQMKK